MLSIRRVLAIMATRVKAINPTHIKYMLLTTQKRSDMKPNFLCEYEVFLFVVCAECMCIKINASTTKSRSVDNIIRQSSS